MANLFEDLAMTRRAWWSLVFVVSTPIGSATKAAAAPRPLVTILDGTATVLEGYRLFEAAEGQALADDSIIETGAKTRLMRIEWPDGQSVNLGADTRIMLDPPGLAARGRRGPTIYLLQGWAKLTSADKTASPGLAAPQFLVQPLTGVVVAHITSDEGWAFMQSGSATLAERDTRRPDQFAMVSGNLYLRAGNAKGELTTHATTAQLKDVPIPFRDTLPSRFDVAGKLTPEPVELAAPSYEQLRPWLTAERPLRYGFTRRFIRLLRNKEFRSALDSNMRAHPEWNPILHPPPPPPPPPAPTLPSRPSSTPYVGNLPASR